MPDLLIELFSEEIPARMQHAAAEGMMKLVVEGLTKNGIAFGGGAFYYTPRRLTVSVTGIPATRAAKSEEIKGPRIDGPEAAINGFLRKNGVENRSACGIKTIDGVDYYFIEKKQEGGPTIDALSPIILTAIQNLTWPKSMRWGAGNFRWARPLHSVLALFDGAVVQGALDLGGGQAIVFSNTTRGHRFLSDGKPFAVTDFTDYQSKLDKAFVILDQNSRREKIWTQVQETARAGGLTVKADEKLLTEIVGLVEWPVPFMGTFDESFLSIPPEVISTSMRENQRYFSLLEAKGKLANRFITVANMIPADEGKTIIYGNEKVLRARLSDAQFFWEQDKKIKLADYAARLDKVRFHEKLGSVAEKTARIEYLAATIAKLTHADETQAARAAHLAKADLVTGMVREFPELQGIMGGYYARLSNEGDAVAAAIATHYSPAGPNDSCPTAPISVAVALADKIDTLVGFFSIDEKPTGSKDPFALRRSALGILRLILENNLDISLSRLFDVAAGLYERGRAAPADLGPFMTDRFRVVLQDSGFALPVIDAILFEKEIPSPVRVRQKVECLSAFIQTPQGVDVLAAMKRVFNILDAAKVTQGDNSQPNAALMTHATETNLYNLIPPASRAIDDGLAQGQVDATLSALIPLTTPINEFLDGVMIMDPDTALRANRLALLAQVRALFSGIADFKRLV